MDKGASNKNHLEIELQQLHLFFGFVASASLFFSIVFHYSYFLVIDFSLLDLFSISDYLTSAIPFFPLLIFMSLLFWSYIYYLSKDDEKDVETFKKSIENDNLRTLFFKKRVLRFMQALLLVALILSIWAFWIWLYYGHIFSFFLSCVLLFTTSLVGFSKRNIKRDLLFFSVLGTFIAFLGGFVEANGDLGMPPNYSIELQNGSLGAVRILRDLSDNIIFMKDNHVQSIRKDNVISIKKLHDYSKDVKPAIYYLFEEMIITQPLSKWLVLKN